MPDEAAEGQPEPGAGRLQFAASVLASSVFGAPLVIAAVVRMNLARDRPHRASMSP